MKIYFDNKSKDLRTEITFEDKSIIHIPPDSPKEIELDDNCITFSVKYVRDFTLGFKNVNQANGKITDQIKDKITEKAAKSIGNAIIQVVNTYKISGLKDDSVIEVNDRAHYLSSEGIYVLFGCFPVLYYFGQAECENAEIEVLSSVPFNRPAFISLYKLIYRTINLYGIFFDIVRYKVQINRHRKISMSDFITNKFKELYSLPLSEREYQFKPVTVLTDKFLNFIRGKLPKRIYRKLERKFKRYL